MNEKFFNLKKEKQDRILNAAMVVFGNNGYKQSSTDEIVEKAQISKGLLFHYFENKLGVYSFLHDYSVKLCFLELSSLLEQGKMDYFALVREREKALCNLLKTYPGIRLFLLRSRREEDPGALHAAEASFQSLRELTEGLKANMDFSAIMSPAKPERVAAMIEYTISGMVTGELSGGVLSPEGLYSETIKYLEMMEKLACGRVTSEDVTDADAANV